MARPLWNSVQTRYRAKFYGTQDTVLRLGLFDHIRVDFYLYCFGQMTFLRVQSTFHKLSVHYSKNVHWWLEKIAERVALAVVFTNSAGTDKQTRSLSIIFLAKSLMLSDLIYCCTLYRLAMQIQAESDVLSCMARHTSK